MPQKNRYATNDPMERSIIFASLYNPEKEKVSLRTLKFHDPAARSPLIQGLPVAVETGWAVGRRHDHAIRIERRAQPSIGRHVDCVALFVDPAKIADPPALARLSGV
jgi:hypothetical protein